MSSFSANEVITQVEGLNTVKTLYRWRKVVEEHFGIKYFQYSFKNEKPTAIYYSDDDVKRFQVVASILSGQAGNQKNLTQAIITAFSSEKPFVKKLTEIEVLEDTFRRVVGDLSNEDRQLRTALAEVNRRLTMIEKQLSEEKDSKLKLFRRK